MVSDSQRTEGIEVTEGGDRVESVGSDVGTLNPTSLSFDKFEV